MDFQIGATFFISLLLNLLTMIIIVGVIHYRNDKNQENLFAYFLFNISIYLLTFLLNKIQISMGAAFGLFAVFSMLRYRTEGISIKDMTYLFMVIAIGLINGIQLPYYESAMINGIFVIATLFFDGNIVIRRESSKLIQYEKIDWIKPENHQLLMDDISQRTGLKVHRVSIESIDFLRDSAQIKIHYYK